MPWSYLFVPTTDDVVLTPHHVDPAIMRGGGLDKASCHTGIVHFCGSNQIKSKHHHVRNTWWQRGRKRTTYINLWLINLSNFALNFWTVWRASVSPGNLFQRFTAVFEKKCFIYSKWHPTLKIFILWPLVRFSATLKKFPESIPSKPLKILNTCIRSPLVRLISNVVNVNTFPQWIN